MMKVSNELAEAVDAVKLIMDGSIMGLEVPRRIFTVLEAHTSKSELPGVSPAVVQTLGQAFMSALLTMEGTTRSIVDAIETCANGSPFSGNTGVSISPSQWPLLYEMVSNTLVQSLGDTKTATTADIDSLFAMLKDENLDTYVSLVRGNGQLHALARCFNCAITTPSRMNSALLRVALASTMANVGIDGIAVCCFIHIASVVQTGRIVKSYIHELVEEVMAASRAGYNASSPYGVDKHKPSPVAIAMADLIVASNPAA
eukprot:jgi/Mesvir1/23380/Mv21075-RA.1